ncbi:hypothetical protein QQ045_009122 [Rhodiola kirilowii]
MAQKAHVPKFGNWEGDNVPYTVYFEKARKGKAGGRRLNPNDPEDNPEIFKALAGRLENQNKPVKDDRSDSEVSNNQHRREKPGHKKVSNGSSYSSFSSSVSSGPPPKAKSDQNPPSSNLPKPKHHRAASIPKFGAWDAADPTSGEGFTVIFNKVKQEKHVKTIHLPALPQPPSKPKNKSNCRSRLASKIPKISCCFPS